MTPALRRVRLTQALPAFQAAAGDPLAIAAVDAFPLREPASKQAYTLIRVRTRSGTEGWGECAAASSTDVAAAARAISGLPATAYEVARTRLHAVPGLRAAVDMAMLDIAGKAAAAPVYQLLGGPTRNKTRVYTALAGDDDDALARSLERGRAAGFRAFSVPVPGAGSPNQGQAFVHRMRRRMGALRKAGGADVDFILDGGGRLSPGDAASLSAEFESFHLLFFDEPSSPLNVHALAKPGSERVTPIGFGRSAQSGAAFQELLREEAADVLRPDLAVHGITGVRRIAALAETYYIAVAPAHTGGPVGTAAALHLAASIPNFFIQQIPWPEAEAGRQMRAAIAPVERAVNGFVSLPTAPGLGVDVKQAALGRFRA